MLTLSLPERVADLPVSWERVVWMDRSSRSLVNVTLPWAVGCLSVLGAVMVIGAVALGEWGFGLLVVLSCGAMVALGVGLPRLGCELSQTGVRIRAFLVAAKVVPWDRVEIGFHRHPGNVEQVAIIDVESGKSRPIPNTPREIGSTDARAHRLADLAAQLRVLAADNESKR